MYVWEVSFYADGNSDYGWVLVEAESVDAARNAARERFRGDLEEHEKSWEELGTPEELYEEWGTTREDEVSLFEEEIAKDPIVTKTKVKVIRNWASFHPDEADGGC